MGEQTPQTEEKGLSTFKDKETQIEETIDEPAPQPGIMNPYPDQTPKKILERWFAIDAYNIGDSSAETFHYVNGVDFLINRSEVGKAMSTFRYLRFKAIEYRVQYSSVPYLYGAGCLTCLPSAGKNFSSILPFFSHTDSVLLDFSEQQDVILSSPWISPSQWIDLSCYQYTGYTPIALLNLHPLIFCAQPHCLKRLDSSVALSANLQIFARFVGAELAGPMADNGLSLQKRFVPGKTRFESQMKAQSNGQWVQNVLNGAAAATGVAGQVFNLAFRGAGGSDGVSSEATEALCDIVGAKAKGQNEKMPKRKQNRQKKSNPQDDQSEQDFKPNVFGSLTYSQSRYLLGTGSQIAESRRHSILGYITKPTLFKSEDLVTGFGQKIVTDLLVGPSWEGQTRYSRIDFVSQMFRLWRGSIRFTFVFFSSPFTSARYNIILSYLPSSTAPPLGTLGSEIIEDITVRGTTVVNFSVPFLKNSQWDRVLHQISENIVASPDAWALYSPSIWIKEINSPFVTGDVTPIIPVYYYIAAGEDFEFRSQICPSPLRQPSGFESQMRVSTFCPPDPMFLGQAKLPNASDDYLDIEGMCQRWNESAAGTFPLDALPHPPTYAPAISTYTGNGVASSLDLWASTFMFFSGQMKLKVPFVGTVTEFNDMAVKMQDNGAVSTTSQYIGAELINRSEDGLALVSQNITNVLECTVPFLSNYQYLPCSQFYIDLATQSSTTDWSSLNVLYDPVIDHNYRLNSGTNVSTYAPPNYWKAGGDDFSFFYDVPPPSIVDTIPGAGGPNPWPRHDQSTGIHNTTVFYRTPPDVLLKQRKLFKCTTCGKDCRENRSCSESITFSSDFDSGDYSNYDSA